MGLVGVRTTDHRVGSLLTTIGGRARHHLISFESGRAVGCLLFQAKQYTGSDLADGYVHLMGLKRYRNNNIRIPESHRSMKSFCDYQSNSAWAVCGVCLILGK